MSLLSKNKVTYPELVVVGFFTEINRFEGHTIWVALLEVVREIAVKDVAKDGLSLLRVVGVEGKTFNHEAVSKEENIHIIQLLELLHALFARYDSLLLSNEVQLFNTPRQHLGVDFIRYFVAVGWPLEVQFLIDCFRVKSSFSLSTIASYPLKSVVLQKLLHILALLLVIIPLCRQFYHLLIVIFARRLHEQSVLLLERVN